ncbi:MAG: maleylpyruvate isomerase family mycothiol-dependent enzyme [Actinomycetota bacterium]|nr:maleylpyruvate isomerase family mycothiol-dependent enzyme [Actinomycetota bacterium]
MAQTLQDMGAFYRETRSRISDLVLSPAVDGTVVVPATPEWTIKDVVGHLTGVCEDILAGNIAGAPSEPWTAAQVERARDIPLQDLIDRWDAAASQVEPLTPMFPDRTANQWVADVVSHEHDLRGALDAPGARDSAAVEVACDFLARAFLDSCERDATAPPLEIVTDGASWATGGNDSFSTRLTAPRFELMRALTGRRSLAQIKLLDWEGDPEPYLGAFRWGPFRPRSEDLLE